MLCLSCTSKNPTLFYVWPIDPAEKPIVFVREEQFTDLLKEISARFKTLYIDPKDIFYRKIKLIEEYDNLVYRAPSQSPFTFPRGEPKSTRAPQDDEIAEFKEICRVTADLGKAKPKSSKSKRQEQQAMAQLNISKQLKRAQCYLGLRPRTRNSGSSVELRGQTVQNEPSHPLDVSKPAPYTFQEDVVVICVDVEAWERSSNIITEIGIATLDTRDIRTAHPGHLGENWRRYIRAKHFRIREHMMYENHEFVPGAADRFEKEFGKTELIALREADRIVASCFKEPFSRSLTEEEQATAGEPPLEKRKIVFLGHNASADIHYLHKIGYDPLNLSNLIDTLDTTSLYRAHKKELNSRSVGGILGEFDLVGWNLHNAGNDAVYTMWIMLATAVAEACACQNTGESSDEGEERKKIATEGGTRELQTQKAAPKEAEIVIPEEFKTW
ncbi:uncharacterized protein PV09_07424 [Verruconis gallopava]|uniref:Gfd2/YDR514C-like C-terminal domain-containing protein n=1 Tax=Verruconis gallopava TaxID=253628 RepID=A0A0D2A2Z1_9PEZI|nr:uncharacterized protein PV09_07424 [Verruconis gallopava]KIW01138.1 hypothetical protein PV09_07424 [Verruconis gallopava]